MRVEPAAAASPAPATSPAVWATPISPETRPRRSTGTWSAIEALRAAKVALRKAWTRHHPTTIPATPRALASTMSPTAPRARPPAIHGRRRPKRLVVRSDKAPKTGLPSVETRAPRPVTRESVASLWPGATWEACRPSSTWIGPNQAEKSPSIVRLKVSDQDRGGIWVGGSLVAT